MPATTVSVWLVMDRPVEVAAAPLAEHLPLAIAQQHRRQTVEVLGETTLKHEKAPQDITAKHLETIQAAKLRIVVFDANGEERYRDKFIYLNGQKVTQVPANTGPLSSWQESIIDLTVDQLERIRMSNVIVVDNPVGDYFKFGDVALAVQLMDGRWVESSHDDSVHSSIGDWAHAEGKVFVNKRSAEMTLTFD